MTGAPGKAFAAAACAAVICSVSYAQAGLGAVRPAGERLHFVAFGDFGRKGKPWEGEVARAIARRAAADPVDIGLTMGDNFYECGVRSVGDPKFHDLWEAFYGSLGVPFYPTFGNHDYGRGDGACALRTARSEAEIEYSKFSKTWRMPARYYTFTAGPVQFFALDTVAWNARERDWLRSLLRAPHPPGIVWRFAYGHHPVYSSGRHHVDARVKQLQRELLPLLARYGVDVYAAGHDHHLEHLRVDAVDLFIAGGGGDAVRPVRHRDRRSLAAASEHGFLDAVADAHSLRITLFNTSLHPLEPRPFEKRR